MADGDNPATCSHSRATVTEQQVDENTKVTTHSCPCGYCNQIVSWGNPKANEGRAG